MNTNTPAEFEFSFLEEGFSARDTVEQKINESSLTVSLLCRYTFYMINNYRMIFVLVLFFICSMLKVFLQDCFC